ncbi:MAG: Metal dependent amidohydrolase [Myxococcaceae bacterium]|nr:Metal dependent amidohydrolase [Myxococcaceae bacterium]
MNRQLLAPLALAALSVCLFGCPSRSVCGDGVKAADEQCDDGNAISGDGCEPGCVLGSNDGGTGGGGGAGVGGGVGGGGGGGGGPVCGNGTIDGSEACDDGNQIPNDGCEPTTCTVSPQTCGNTTREGTEECDDGNQVALDGCEPTCQLTATPSVTCPNVPAAPDAGTCTLTPGDGNKLFTGVVLATDKTYLGGQVLVNAAGNITCVGCDCSATAGASTATKIVCPKGVLSPGLINTHDHMTFGRVPYVPTAAAADERYEHRHDWRVGGAGHDNHTKISAQSGITAANLRWSEVRQIMSGTTSVITAAQFSTAGNGGMMRNLDSTGGQEGLGEGAVNSQTFPLGDTSGTELTTGCAYPGIDTPADIPTAAAYLPHVSEGIEASATNEFRCVSAATGGGQDLLGPRTSIVHGIGVKASDIGLLALKRSGLIWSPRSNVSLYGDTASVPTYVRMGVNVALGMDWVISGSMNMLRELKCAASLNEVRFNRLLSDEQLWRMATSAAADVTQVGEKLGRIQVGKVADLAIYRQQGTKTHRSVIDADPADVVMTMRGGKVLYGDAPIVTAFDTASMCETLDVCGVLKSICTRSEFTTPSSATVPARSLSELQAANATLYPLFFCGPPANEPSCDPVRASRNSKNGSTTYTAVSSGDLDGDGIANATDNCPDVFNPVRPMDNGKQADQDGDGKGDPCDVCPLNANSTACATLNPNDSDGDGVLNAVDNCPADANPAQTDTDGDLKGDVCDACAAPNPGAQACPATIYTVKNPAGGLLGQAVSLGNVLVTAVHTSGFFLQVHESETGYTTANYSAVFAYKPGSGLVAGDRINVTSAVPTNYFGQLELAQVVLPVGADGGTATITTGNPLPAPTLVANPADIATDGGTAQQLEAVLVKVNAVTVTDTAPVPGAQDPLPTNEFEVTGGLRIDDLLFRPPTAPVVGQQFTSITGLLNFRNSNMKVEPRNAADIVAGPPLVAAVEPAQGFIREGATASLPAPLAVRLTNVWTSDVAVDVQSSSIANLLIGDGGLIIVPTGSLTAPIPLTGVLQGDAGVTASIGISSKSAAVRVLGLTELSTLTALAPAAANVAPGGKVTLTARLDIPSTTATVISIAVTPAGFGTTPVTVTVPADMVEVSFDFTADPQGTGNGSVTATLGSVMKSTAISMQAVSTNHLVISEVAVRGAPSDGGTAAANSDEFIELYNPTAVAVDVSGWKLQYKSATGPTFSDKAVLPVGTSIPSRGYFLVASRSYNGTVVPDLRLTIDLGLAGDSGHVRLGTQDVSTAKVDPEEVDRLGYGTAADSPEGGAKTPITPNFTTTFERKATPGATVSSMFDGGLDAEKGNGLDTDQNGNLALPDGGSQPGDFILRPFRDPQSSGSPAEP